MPVVKISCVGGPICGSNQRTVYRILVALPPSCHGKSDNFTVHLLQTVFLEGVEYGQDSCENGCENSLTDLRATG